MKARKRKAYPKRGLQKPSQGTEKRLGLEA